MLSTFSLDKLNGSKQEYEKLVRHMDDDAPGGESAKSEEKGKLSAQNITPEAKESRRTASSTIPSFSRYFSTNATPAAEKKKSTCLPCCCKEDEQSVMKNKFEKAVLTENDRRETITVSTLHDFNTELGFLTRNARAAFSSLNDVKASLEFANDPSAEAQGLSRVGSIVWLITYSIQHLVNPMAKPVNLATQLIRTLQLYQDLADLTHKLAQTVKLLEELLHHHRECAAWIVKKTENTFLLEESPFDLKPEMQPTTRRIKRRIGISFDESNTDESDGLFHVQWSPLTILVKLKPDDENLDPFASLDIDVKIPIVEKFMEEALRLMKNANDKIVESTEYTTFKRITYNSNVNSMKADLTSRMYPVVNFLNTGTQLPFDKEVKLVQRAIDDFWYTIDALKTVGVEVKNLIQESRDIVRTSYVYATQFYHWKLVDYDSFEPISYPKGRRPTRTSLFFAKVVGNRRISENLLFLSLADFTSSIYQYIAQEHAIFAGGVTMILETFEEDDRSEPWGLVPGDFDYLKTAQPKGHHHKPGDKSATPDHKSKQKSNQKQQPKK